MKPSGWTGTTARGQEAPRSKCCSSIRPSPARLKASTPPEARPSSKQARLIRVLQLALIELTFQVYRDDGDGDGPFLRDYVWPLPPLPPSIRKIFFPELFKLKPGDLPPA